MNPQEYPRRLADRLFEGFRAASLRPGPSSLCELRLSEEDVRGLPGLLDAELGSPQVFHGWHVGALLLTFAAETARREGGGHMLWPVVVERFPRRHRERFFQHGHPTGEAKRLIETAVDRLRLRNVFDRDEGHRWYLTVQLQFGLTLNTAAERLPEWLTGRAPLPRAVEILLAGPQAHDGFRRLWKSLLNYRLRNATEHDLRKELKDGPWIPPERIDEIIRAARAQPSLDGVRQDEPSSVLTTVDESFLEMPRAEWSEERGLRFRFAVRSPDPCRFAAPDYELRWGERVLVSWRRAADGTFSGDRTEVVLTPGRTPSVFLLFYGDGRPAGQQEVEHWNADGMPEVFHIPGGRRIADPLETRLEPSASYLFWLPDGWTMEPRPERWKRRADCGRTAYLLPGGWNPETLRLTAHGREIWRQPSREALRRSYIPRPEVTVTIDGLGEGVLGEPIAPRVAGLPGGRDVLLAEGPSGKARFDPRTGRLQGLRLTPEIASGKGRVTFVLDGTVPHWLRGKVTSTAACAPRGIVLYEADERRIAGERDFLRTADCRSLPLRIYAGRLGAAGSEPPALMEGPHFVAWAGTKPTPLSGVLGTGAPLLLCRSPYEPLPDQAEFAPVRLIAGTFDQGCVRAATCGPDGIRIRSDRRMEPGPEHFAVVWRARPDAVPEIIAADRIATEDDGRTWRLPIACGEFECPPAVGIGYAGQRLGMASAPDRAAEFLREVLAEPADPSRNARWARWLRLPLLLSSHHDSVPVCRKFFERHAVAVRRVWEEEEFEAAGRTLRFDDSFERRRADRTMLRELWLELQPSPAQVAEWRAEFGRGGNEDALAEMFFALLRDHPLLAGRICRVWTARDGFPRRESGGRYLELLGNSLRLSKRPCFENLLTNSRWATSANAGAANAGFADATYVRETLVGAALATVRASGAHRPPHRLDPKIRPALSAALQVRAFRERLAALLLFEPTSRLLTEPDP